MARSEQTRDPVVLQIAPETPVPCVVRLPHQGPPSSEQPPGHWYVEVTAGAGFSAGVTPRVQEAGEHPPGVWLLLVVALVLTAITCWAVL
jgi:hypothetical protein